MSIKAKTTKNSYGDTVQKHKTFVKEGRSGQVPRTQEIRNIMRIIDNASEVFEEVPATVVAAGILGGIFGAVLVSFFGKK